MKFWTYLPLIPLAVIVSLPFTAVAYVTSVAYVIQGDPYTLELSAREGVDTNPMGPLPKCVGTNRIGCTTMFDLATRGSGRILAYNAPPVSKPKPKVKPKTSSNPGPRTVVAPRFPEGYRQSTSAGRKFNAPTSGSGTR